jgi:formylglycine-generating enzyme required for sulfatase activity
VTFVQGFWLFDTACTQALWQTVMGVNPSRYNNLKDSPRHPVEQVSWSDAQAFLIKINQYKLNLNLILPNEAQWEYACRAGTTTPFSFGATITPDQVNYDGNHPYGDGEEGLYRAATVPVASLPPNLWGLYEMHGNVWEWCADHWPEIYQGALNDDAAASGGGARVTRGGSWFRDAQNVRSASRNRNYPEVRNDDLGFRCARLEP